MTNIKDQRGSGHVMLIMLVVVLAAVGFAGYRVMQQQNTSVATADTVSPAPTKSVAEPSKINNKTQAAQASKTLDAESIDKTLDSTQLDAELDSVL